jgi:hypothetical protein
MATTPSAFHPVRVEDLQLDRDLDLNEIARRLAERRDHRQQECSFSTKAHSRSRFRLRGPGPLQALIREEPYELSATGWPPVLHRHEVLGGRP